MADTSKWQSHLPDVMDCRLPFDRDNDGLRQFDSSLLAKALIWCGQPNPRPCRCMEQGLSEPERIGLGHVSVLEQNKNKCKRGTFPPEGEPPSASRPTPCAGSTPQRPQGHQIQQIRC